MELPDSSKNESLLYDIACAAQKVILLKPRTRVLRLPMNRLISKEYKLQFTEDVIIPGLRVVLRIHLKHPLTATDFTLSCYYPRKGQRRVALISFYHDDRRWIEERYDIDDFIRKSKSLNNPNNILKLVEEVGKTWAINNLATLKFMIPNNMEDLFNEDRA